MRTTQLLSHNTLREELPMSIGFALEVQIEISLVQDLPVLSVSFLGWHQILQIWIQHHPLIRWPISWCATIRQLERNHFLPISLISFQGLCLVPLPWRTLHCRQKTVYSLECLPRTTILLNQHALVKRLSILLSRLNLRNLFTPEFEHVFVLDLFQITDELWVLLLKILRQSW